MNDESHKLTMFMCPTKGCRTPKLTGNGGGPNSTTSDQPSGEVSPLYIEIQRKREEKESYPSLMLTGKRLPSELSPASMVKRELMFAAWLRHCVWTWV